MLSKKCQTQKKAYCTIPFVGTSKNKKFESILTESRLVGPVATKEDSCNSGGDENVFIWIVMVTQVHTFFPTTPATLSGTFMASQFKSASSYTSYSVDLFSIYPYYHLPYHVLFFTLYTLYSLRTMPGT